MGVLIGPSRIATGLALLLAPLSAAPARAEIVELKLEAAEPFAGGQSFGTAGAYVRIKGVARGELDPKAAANRVIADIDKAPVNARGKVEYATEVFLLRPADPAKGNGLIFYDVTNRGKKFFLHWLADAKSAVGSINDPRTAEHAGNGFGLERGYTLVWSGWDPYAPTADNGIRLDTPIATNGGKPIVQRIRHEFEIATRGPGDGASLALPYPAADLATAKARLVVRDFDADKRREIAADAWEFKDKNTIALKGAAKFEPIKIYELWYDATEPKVLGIGYAATRDLVSYLRHGPADALKAAGTAADFKTIGFGISQSGRYLRHFLELGMNGDEKGRKVFDGVFGHISGAGKVFANHRFGMSGRTATQHEDRFYPENWFPFSARADRDPFSGKTARLIGGKNSNVPKLFETNTSTEYWQKGASLIHTDPRGQADALLPPEVRVYLIAGTQHGGRSGLDDKPGQCAMPRNPHSASPALRALVIAMEDWVLRNRVPPASRVPEIARKTAVSGTAVAMPKVAGLAQPVGATAIGPAVDWVDPPQQVTRAYGVLVPAVDADGNEVAGLRLPSIAVPVGTYTGWNRYKLAPTDMCDRDGTYVGFAKSKADREKAEDARLSLAERYKSPAEYVARVKAAADKLVAERLLLAKDATAYVEAAKKVAF
jgi:Alpha/beta hydrolase domain